MGFVIQGIVDLYKEAGFSQSKTILIATPVGSKAPRDSAVAPTGEKTHFKR